MLEKMHLKINTLRQELCPAAAGRQRLELPADQKSFQRGAGFFLFGSLSFFLQAKGSAVLRGRGQSCSSGGFVRAAGTRGSGPAAPWHPLCLADGGGRVGTSPPSQRKACKKKKILGFGWFCYFFFNEKPETLT